MHRIANRVLDRVIGPDARRPSRARRRTRQPGGLTMATYSAQAPLHVHVENASRLMPVFQVREEQYALRSRPIPMSPS